MKKIMSIALTFTIDGNSCNSNRSINVYGWRMFTSDRWAYTVYQFSCISVNALVLNQQFCLMWWNVWMKIDLLIGKV